MPLSTFGKFSVSTGIVAFAVAVLPFPGTAAAQSYYPPPGYEMDVNPPPREGVDVYSPPRGAVDGYPPPGETVEANRPPRDAVNVPAQQISGTTTPLSAVSMRAGPGTDNPVIGTLRPGMPLQLLATANHGWMQVQSSVGIGWVYGSYLASRIGMPGSTPGSTNVDAAAPIATSGNNQSPNGVNPPAATSNQPPPEITSP